MPMKHDDLRRFSSSGSDADVHRIGAVLFPREVNDILTEYDAVVAERDRLRAPAETPRDISMKSENQRLRDENNRLRDMLERCHPRSGYVNIHLGIHNGLPFSDGVSSNSALDAVHRADEMRHAGEPIARVKWTEGQFDG